MWRSPILSLFFLFFIFSCQKQGGINSLKTEANGVVADTLVSYYSEIGAQFNTKNQFDSAFYYFNKSKELATHSKNNAYLAYNLVAMAYIQQTFADYASSEETLTEALPFLEENTTNQLAALNLFAIAAKEVKNHQVAIRYYEQLVPLIKDSVNQSSVANNRATVYMELLNYEKAISLLAPYLKTTILDTLPQKKARIMDNLGFAYFKNEQSARGLALMNEALEIRKQANDSYGSIESYLHLAKFYRKKNLSKSTENASLAYDLATKHQSVDERLEALSILMTQNSKAGENTFALTFSRLNDSITTARNKAKNQFAKIKYDNQKAIVEALKYKGERAELALKLQSKQFQNYLMGFGLLFLILVLFYLTYYFRTKNRAEKIKESYKTETRIAKMVHDELANDIFYSMTFAETQDLKNALKKEQLLDHLDQIYHKTRNISRENSPIETGETYFPHLKEMLSSYKSPKVEVIIRKGNPIDWSKITDDKKIALQRVLQELMVNMKKHSQASFVVIGFDAGSKEIKISYSDNGIGCSGTSILKNGLQNAENRIQAINGQLTFDFSNPKGFKAQILIPN